MIHILTFSATPPVRQGLIWLPFSDEIERPGQSCRVINWGLEIPGSAVFPLTAAPILHTRKDAKAVSHFCSLFPYSFLMDLSVSGTFVCTTNNIFGDAGNFHLSNPNKDQLRGRVAGIWRLTVASLQQTILTGKLTASPKDHSTKPYVPTQNLAAL